MPLSYIPSIKFWSLLVARLLIISEVWDPLVGDCTREVCQSEQGKRGASHAEGGAVLKSATIVPVHFQVM